MSLVVDSMRNHSRVSGLLRPLGPCTIISRSALADWPSVMSIRMFILHLQNNYEAVFEMSKDACSGVDRSGKSA